MFYQLVFQETSTFQVKSTQSTPVTSWRSVHTRWVYMWPVRRFYLQWWFFLFTSENPMCTSWGQVSQNISSQNQLSIQAQTTLYKKSVPESKTWYLHRYKHYAASVYKLVLSDPDLKKLASSRLEIGTYTTNTVKLVGSCTFCLVHPGTKCLQEVIFYITSSDGSVLLLCASTLALGLIQPHTRLDLLPSGTSLITAKTNPDHPKKIKC